MSLWCVPCPECTSLPFLIYLLNSYPAFRLAWLPLTKEAFPPSRLAPFLQADRTGHPFPRVFTLPQTCMFSSTCHTYDYVSALLPDSCLCLCLFSAWLGAGTQWIFGWMDSWTDLSLGKAYPEVTRSYILLCGLQSLYERALSQRRRKYNFPQTVILPKCHSS